MIITRFFYLVFTLVYLVMAQNERKEMKIDVQENGKLEMDEEMSYYVLKIPKNVEKNTKNLVIRIKETDGADLALDDFSDPDIYVSKVKFK
jgi:hypothetical protein